ncbi:MAG: transposase [Hyphomonadaceae bacterium]|nr:transposase [Hyphomonadaceae bacterium]
MILGLADALPEFPDGSDAATQRKRFDAGLDRGLGSCVLKHPKCAEIVENELLHHDGDRYHLIAWCVMPNHVHVVLEQIKDLAGTVRRWKSWTARQINAFTGSSGEVWFREYFDRFARNAQQLQRMIDYVEANPVAAGLVAESVDWDFSSAGFARRAGQAPGAPRG